MELPASQWHSYVCITDAATFFEVKEGPYDPDTATEFAAWAPAEGAAAAAPYCAWLRAAQPGDTAP